MRRAVLWTLLTLCLYLAAEAALFRTGFYFRFVEPNSTTGNLESALYWLRHTPVNPRGEVAVFGDSRVAEGFSAPIATATIQNRLAFRNLSVPGMSLRNWFYLLRDADPARNRFRAIVLTLERYADNDSYDSPPDRIRDIRYSLGRLRLADCLDFPFTMTLPENRQAALTGCLLKGVPLRPDLAEFLRNPRQRIQEARASRQHGLEWNSAYTGIERNMVGLEVDLPRNTIVRFPPNVDSGVQVSLRQSILPERPPDAGVTTEYRKLWLGRLMDLYRGTSTKFVFVEMPRAPISIPEDPTPPRFIRSVQGQRGVAVLPAFTFRDLETPETFGDGLHLNAKGRVEFSKRLAGFVEAILAGSGSGASSGATK